MPKLFHCPSRELQELNGSGAAQQGWMVAVSPRICPQLPGSSFLQVQFAAWLSLSCVRVLWGTRAGSGHAGGEMRLLSECWDIPGAGPSAPSRAEAAPAPAKGSWGCSACPGLKPDPNPDFGALQPHRTGLGIPKLIHKARAPQRVAEGSPRAGNC